MITPEPFQDSKGLQTFSSFSSASVTPFISCSLPSAQTASSVTGSCCVVVHFPSMGCFKMDLFSKLKAIKFSCSVTFFFPFLEKKKVTEQDVPAICHLEKYGLSCFCVRCKGGHFCSHQSKTGYKKRKGNLWIDFCLIQKWTFVEVNIRKVLNRNFH